LLDPDNAGLADEVEDLRNKMQALKESATHEVATSRAGLAYHAELLAFEARFITREVAQCSPENLAASSGRVWLLSEAICASIASMPDDAALNPLDTQLLVSSLSRSRARCASTPRRKPMSFTQEQIDADHLQRQIIAAREIHDEAQRDLREHPDTPRRKELELMMREAVEFLREAALASILPPSYVIMPPPEPATPDAMNVT
jgi:hypothetical protein